MNAFIAIAILLGIQGGALGDRALSWDATGMVPLSYETALTPKDQALLGTLKEGEAPKAWRVALLQLEKRDDDFIAAWVLVQSARLLNKGGQLADELQAVYNRRSTSPAILYAYLKACSLANVQLPPKQRSSNDPRWVELRQRTTYLLSKSTALAKKHLPLLTVLMATTDADWVLPIREAAEGYKKAHPSGPDIRPLLCRAYYIGSVSTYYDAQGRALEPRAEPNGPQPDKAIDIGLQVVKEKPKWGLAHYQLGRAYVAKGDFETAKPYFAKYLELPDQAAPLAECARKFVATGDIKSFYIKATE